MSTDQTFPGGPAFSHLTYSATLKMMAVDDSVNPPRPGWVLPSDIEGHALGQVAYSLTQEVAARTAGDAILKAGLDAVTLTANNALAVATAATATATSGGSSGGSTDGTAAILAERLARIAADTLLRTDLQAATSQAASAVSQAGQAIQIASASGGALVTAEIAARTAADAALRISLSGLVSVPVDGNATVALTDAQAANAIVVLTGVLTGNIDVTVPATVRTQVVQNNTTGPFVITYRTPNGAGVTVPQTKSVEVFCDGTSVYASGSYYDYSMLPASVRRVPLAFVFPGKPGAGQTVNVPLAMAQTILAGFAETATFAGTLPTANMVFTVNRIAFPSGTVTPVGTVTLLTTGLFDAAYSNQAAMQGSPRDVVQLVAPASADATGADIGITLMTAKA